jgi:hypothetical protein
MVYGVWCVVSGIFRGLNTNIKIPPSYILSIPAMIYDIIIVGAGISGLYAAYKLKTTFPHVSFLIIEKNKKSQVGGRAGNESFYGVDVVTGAGIGRKRKDKLLYKLTRDLNIETHEFVSKKYYANNMNPLDVEYIMEYLKNEYKKRPTSAPSLTFKKFATEILGKKIYSQFLETSGYTDYEKEDAYETLYYYGMDDNYTNSRAFSVPWKRLVSKLVNEIGESNIKFANGVAKIRRQHHVDTPTTQFYVETETGVSYICKKIIVATNIRGIRTLFPSMSIYKEIEGQPFLRVYGKFSKQSIPYLKEYLHGYTCVKGPLQKIIPMDVEKGVYMIAYSDNESALQLSSYLENTEKNRKIYCELVETALGIPGGRLDMIALKSFYWNIGTHYYKPLDKKKYGTRDDFIRQAQNPTDGIVVVGEVVSHKQGWTEGALESVEKVVTNRWVLED